MSAAASEREQVKFWRTPDLGNLELMRATYITHSFPRHSHDSFGIGIIEQGALRFNCEDKAHIIPAGNLILINPGQVHHGHAATASGWTYRIIYPEATLLQQALSELNERRCELPYFPNADIHDHNLAQLLLRLHQTLETPTTLLERESRLVLTLTQLIARHAGERPTWQIGREQQAVRWVRQYLEAHYAENVSLQQLAQLTQLKPLRLLRVFRQEVGLPPHAYLTQVRVLRAKALLALNWPIAQVALATGFTDQSHLNRHFKRLVGTTPRQYWLGCKNVQDS
ncbi:AraC family transcriptional regulator [Leptolyngbya sp. FACHB-261]|uniref:AraC family transcriptional regulator n=1 Tax=Leptolyngbya sp. FACHB-261 TaxID=2692806 RepID=UPI0016894989|nr:AraC family transcriptional regulator [Leptolyngbya sp. FACHB-261]MBD2099646.1 AraC family transcriptional regulator [Leptolyngbya sp. FACHB-261]